MSHLPEDLLARIDADFADLETRKQIIESLEKLWNGGINVGPGQLARAIVFLADGDFDEFKTLRKTFCGDPRDLLLAANRRLQNQEYWFSAPFSEMGPLKDESD